MAWLVLGLVLFLGAHSVRIVAEGWRAHMLRRMGELPWKGLMALLSVAGFAVRRSVRTRPKSTRPLLAFEVATGFCVFVLTSFLAVTPPNGNGSSAVAFHSTLVEAGVLADITIEPGAVGNNAIHLLFSPPGGSLAPVKDVQVRYELPTREIPFMSATITLSAVNHWIGVMNIPYSGEWTVEVIIRSSANETIRYSTSVAISE